MPRERQKKKGESSALFTQVELLFVCVFGHCCTNDDTPHKAEEAKWECENLCLSSALKRSMEAENLITL